MAREAQQKDPSNTNPFGNDDANKQDPREDARQASKRKDQNAAVPEDESPEDKVKRTGEPVFFETTIAKLVERENAKGDKEWVEVMSDNLYPGEKLKRTADEEETEEKARKARQERAEADKSSK